MSELLSVSDIARLCQVHELTIRRHIDNGQLKSVRVGRAVRVRREDLEAYLQPRDRRVAPGATRRRSRSLTTADPIWDIVGMFDSADASWVSGDKRRALAEAYAAKP